MTTDIETRKTERPTTSLLDWFEPVGLAKLFDGLRPFEDRIRVEEEMVGDDLVIRAELPGVDPDKDVDVTIDGDMLTVSAERRKEEKSEKDGQFRSEFRYGSFRRSLRMPRGVTADDIGATYRDGILEVRVPVPKSKDTTTKVSISKG
jgi:HSP20 family protein